MKDRRTLGSLRVMTALVCGCLSLARVNAGQVNPARGPIDLALTDPALLGAIDIHSHLDPDSPGAGEQVRGIDVFAFAKIAQARGMRGFVNKAHLGPQAAATAYLARTYAAPGLEVFGCMALNLAAGGINVAAVEHFARIKGGWGRIVMMPTRDAERERNAPSQALASSRPWMLLMPPGSPQVVSTVGGGQLLPEVKHLISVMAKMKTADSNGPLVLATGHASDEEHILLAREARRQALQVVLTHGSRVALPVQQEAAQLGALIEYSGLDTWRRNAEAALRDAAQKIRKVGAESIIISTDCGQMGNPYPTDCLVLAAQGLRAQGISEREIDLMFKDNPARLLGLSPRTGAHERRTVQP
jgi:predicted TIM-barrel fold metal-dependent hydrolase